jgi:uridine phosphorylase
MPFPNFEGKHAHSAFFTAQEFIALLRKSNNFPEIEIPEAVIFCYNPGLMRHIAASEEAEKIKLFTGDFYQLKSTGNKIGVIGGFGIGAPAVANVIECFIALGVKRFASIGVAGTLQKDINIADFVVCDKAIRDEGVSHHYLPPEKYSYPSPALTEKLKQELEKLSIPYRIGTTWTIDAIYRETVEEARHYQSEGVCTVEMEASALFAVCQLRQVEMASAFVISDSLAALTWNPQFTATDVKEALRKLYQAAKACLIS